MKLGFIILLRYEHYTEIINTYFIIKSLINNTKV